MPSTGTLVFNDQKLQAPEMYATESLGVGVSVPTSNLEVTGNAYVSSNLEIGTANLFVDTTTGNVGISTATPESKLHITNTTDSTGTGDAFISGLVSNGSNRKPTECLRLQGQWRSPGSGALLRFTNYHGGGTNPNTGEYNTAGIAGFDYANQWGGGLCLYTAPNTTNGGDLTPRMTIDSSGFVGIGTTSPGSLLTIESTSGNQMRLNYNADWYNVIERDSNGNLNFLEKRGASASLVNLMTIKTEGNVGIGTTSPEDILDIRKGSGTGEVSVQVRSGGLFIRRHNGSTYPLIQTDFGMTRPRIMMSDTSGTTRVFISGDTADSTYFNGGNVGIGTTSPDEKLHVNGNILTNDKRFNSVKKTVNLAYNTTTTVHTMTSGDCGLLFAISAIGNGQHFGVMIFQWTSGRSSASTHTIFNSGYATFTSNGTNIWIKHNDSNGATLSTDIRILKF